MKKDWTYKKLGEVCDVLNGYAFKSDKYVDKGIRVIRIANVQKGVIVDDQPAFYPLATQSEIDRYLLNEGDILMSLTGNIGRVGILQKEMLPAALNQRVACLRMINNALHSRFFFHYLNSDLFEQKCIASARGIAQLNMSTEWLKEQFIPIPPLSIQRSIVSELDLLHSLIEKKQEQLRALDNLAQSLFYQMFGDPITNPMGWQVKKLGEVCDVRDGTHDSPKYVQYSEYVLITSKNIVNGEIDFSSCNYITKEDYDSINKRSKVDVGDIIMPMIGTIGGPIIVKETSQKYCIKNVALIKFNITGVLNVYVKSILENQSYTEYLKSLNKGGTQKFIALGTIRTLPLPLPPLSLQQSFAAKVSAIEEQKRFISQSIKDVESLLAQRMDHYFG